ncbi:MAG TPA: peptidase M15 family protein [Leptolyngbyaceae cyanobacterium M65_K2018_010]|nr:peptidase M15 family protein [Leptolyngbyaceae cyanobacterium M65_K2018_010]
MFLTTKKDTFFKKSQAQASTLSDGDKVLVKAGQTLDIQYYIDLGDHWQVVLATPRLGDNQTLTWFVYEPDVELKSSVTLTVISDTLFKQEPKLSSQLTNAQKVFVKNGTQYELLGYLPATGNHLKITLAGANLGPEKRNTWYVYQPDVKVSGTRQELRVVSDTLFKAQPRLSSELGATDKIFIKKGSVFLITSHGDIDRNHIKVALEGTFLGSQNRNTWYTYVPDVEINGNAPDNNPKDKPPVKQPATPKDPGKALRFPGFSSLYYTNHPIIWKTPASGQGNFTWGEATHNGTRIPENQNIVYGMVRIAQALEEIRHLYGGRAITINSWYRPRAINAAVGGASMSRHLQGDAVDFNVTGIHPYDVYKRLDGWWGSRGGLASSSVFTHIDTRGYRARWSYGY